MPSDPLFEKLNAVHDRQSFLAFVEALATDREQATAKEEQERERYRYGGSGWENGTIEAFLSAAVACAQSTGIREGGWLPVEPSWRAFAEFLWTGKIYE